MTDSRLDTLLAALRERMPRAALTADSRRVRPGDIFLAWPGAVHDGRAHIAAAVEAGAAAVVWEPAEFVWPADVRVENFALAGLARLAARLAVEWYGDPSSRLWSIGITGTNGKTSCSHWIAEALTRVGRKTAIVGTLGNGLVNAMHGSSHTTPDAVTLQGLLAGFADEGAAALAMEVSSHALDQGRVTGMHFDVAVLTNLSRDHLDYHGDMEAYAAAKSRLFAWPGLKAAVLNLDDALGARLATELAGRVPQVLTYGIHQGDIHTEALQMDADGVRFMLVTPVGTVAVRSPLLGRFNAENLLAVSGALLASGLSLAEVAAQLEQFTPVAGRLQVLPREAGGPRVVIDYAHTPDALEKVLATLRPITAGRLCCVFGCGGGRDRGKRPLMGTAVAQGADCAIVTSDNPRHEDPQTILNDILVAMPAGQRALVDRGAAILAAIAEAEADDVVLIAGKGHENYQEIGGQRLPFSDAAVARQALKNRGSTHEIA
ncbi:MAG: UDP-N-acetylmuramoyl-L-alanyl-D-glutamate--2,6-diaminopimelate ligase [Betaproteobacteria bacterium]|nr:UDP-N-acetylmuramoyl-L-alanyl-D-glutamate--2,6-diaminopimelate ligase [Betaproteobacteria bacterium]